MLSVVYDTNIYISALVLDSQIVKLIKLAKDQTFNLYISSHIIEEIREVMTDKFQTSLSLQKVIFRRIKQLTNLTYPTTNPHIIPNNHPDNQILATCDSCSADYLVTGDKKHLLPLKKFGRTKIVTAQEFFAILEK
jgi:putative PIN family toxin of toxin-antitoxin system